MKLRIAALAAALTLGAGASQASTVSNFETHGNVWGAPGVTVSYSFMADGVDCAAEFVGCTISALSSFMPAGFVAHVEDAFAAWSAVANINFVEVADGGEAFNANGTSGDIRLGGHVFDGANGVLAHGFFPPPNGNTAAGDIHFDVAENWTNGQGLGGFDIFTVMAHEIGHAIGLEHTNVPDSLMNPFYTEAFLGLQADDIAGAQALYGVRPIAAVPLPAGMPLLLSGLALMGLFGTRRRNKAA